MTNDTEANADSKAIAHRISYDYRRRLEEFRILPLSLRSAVFIDLSPTVRQDLLEELEFSEVVELLDHLDPRNAQRILARMSDSSRRKRLMSRLKNDMYEKLEHFTQFHPKASIALAHLNYVFLDENLTIGDTAAIIEDYLHNTGKIPEVLVHQAGSLLGEVPLATLVRERNTAKLKRHIKKIRSIKYNVDKHEVAPVLTDRPHSKIVILDSDESVLGIIYSDDILDLVGQRPAKSLYSFAGVEPSERPFDNVLSKVKSRYRWLIINLATAFLAAGVISAFENTLSELVLLAAYMPIVAGMGGNAATQTLAVMVRGIAIGEIDLRSSLPAILREVGAGFINGVIVATALLAVALVFKMDMRLVPIAITSMILNLMIAGFFGTFVPVVMRYFGKDPAASATVFITTATDVFGFLCLFGLATIWLL